LLCACAPAVVTSTHSSTDIPTAQNGSVNSESPSSSTTEVNSEKVKALVTNVVDGDTIEVNVQGKVYKLRYTGIDAPEPNSVDTYTRNIALSSASKNRALVSGREVELKKDISETDKYGRLLRYVYIDELFVNAELVRLGYAQASPYPPDTKYQELFNTLQSEAKAFNRGIWASGGFYPPSTSPEKGIYVGSKKSDKYHFPSCVWAQQIKPDNEIWFSSKEEAQSKGYVPCKVCRPPQ